MNGFWVFFFKVFIVIPFTRSLFFKGLAEPRLGVGLSLHRSQQELLGPH